MRAPMPMPPALPLPGAFNVPRQQLAMPEFNTPTWVTPPIYRNPQPEDVKTGRTEGEKEDKGESAEREGRKPTIPEGTMPDIPEVELPPVVIPEVNEVNTVTIPIIEVEVPLPKTEIVVIAVTTASVSAVAAVGGTMVATSVFRQLMKLLKPVMKTIVKKLAGLRGKEVKSWSRERLAARRLRVKGE